MASQVKAKRLPTIPIQLILDLLWLDGLSAQATRRARSAPRPQRLGHRAGQTSAGNVLASDYKEISFMTS